jgi:hypothetical protein
MGNLGVAWPWEAKDGGWISFSSFLAAAARLMGFGRGGWDTRDHLEGQSKVEHITTLYVQGGSMRRWKKDWRL